MFGYVRPSLETLSETEKQRYHAVYCGLCRVLGDRYGFAGKMSLTYDLTFLILFLSSLYEPEEEQTRHNCIRHPLKQHDEITSEVTGYAADMTVALMYHKCLDDWMDDHALMQKGAAALMKKQYQRVSSSWPAQCTAIENAMKELTALEKDGTPPPDAAASCFGDLMGILFCWKHDFWQQSLFRFGRSLGRFIYLADAAVDYAEDMKTSHPNPLKGLSLSAEDLHHVLMAEIADATAVLEELPLVQDIHILRNTLYEGVWLIYNQQLQAQHKEEQA